MFMQITGKNLGVDTVKRKDKDPFQTISLLQNKSVIQLRISSKTEDNFESISQMEEVTINAMQTTNLGSNNKTYINNFALSLA